MPSGLTQADVSAALDVVINRLNEIVQACSKTINQLNTAGPFTVQSDEDAIIKSLTTFVQAHQALLNILISKAGLIPELVPYVGPPLAAVSRQLESIVDTILWQLMDLLPDKQSDVTSQKDTLDVTLSAMIKAWTG